MRWQQSQQQQSEQRDNVQDAHFQFIVGFDFVFDDASARAALVHIDGPADQPALHLPIARARSGVAGREQQRRGRLPVRGHAPQGPQVERDEHAEQF
jgi:hypothetical protein